MSRYHKYVDSSRKISAPAGPNPGSMRGRDGGKVLDDTESDPPYNANIGPGGPDMNRVGFDRVKCFVKAKMSPFMGVDQQNQQGQGQTMVPQAQPVFTSNIESGGQSTGGAANVSGKR